MYIYDPSKMRRRRQQIDKKKGKEKKLKKNCKSAIWSAFMVF